MSRHRVTPRDRRSGASTRKTVFTPRGQLSTKHRSLRVDGIVDRGSWIVERVEQDGRVVGAIVQHHQPGSMFMGLGAWRGTAAMTR